MSQRSHRTTIITSAVALSVLVLTGVALRSSAERNRTPETTASDSTLAARDDRDPREADLLEVARGVLFGPSFARERFVQMESKLDEDWNHRPDLGVLLDAEAGAPIPDWIAAECYAVADAHGPGVISAAEEVHRVAQSALAQLWDGSAYSVARIDGALPTPTEAREIQADLVGAGADTLLREATIGDWKVSLVVDSVAFPEFGRALHELKRARALRRNEMRTVLEAHLGR